MLARLARGLLALLLMVSGLTAVLLVAPAGAAPDDPGEGGDDKARLAAAAPGELAVTVAAPEPGTLLNGGLEYYRWQPETGAFEIVSSQYVEAGAPSTTTTTVDAGEYYVSYVDYTGMWRPAFSEGATQPPAGLGEPGVITVDETGSSTTISLRALRVPVTGRVVDEADSPVSAELSAQSDELSGDSTLTEADGTFTLDLQPGEYTLRVSPTNDDLEPRTLALTVLDDGTDLGDLVVVRPGRWQVSGLVRTADGAPADSADVALYQGADFDADGSIDSFDYVDDTTTGPDGAYAFPQVRAGRSYTTSARSVGHRRTYLGGGTVLQGADVVEVTEDVVVDDITLVEASTVTGIVTGPDGPAAGVEVELQRFVEDDGFDAVDFATTDETGRFLLTTDAPGSYTLYFDATDASALLTSGYLEGTEPPAGAGSPGTFDVGETATAITRDKTLARASSVTGSVVGTDGLPVPGASVVTYVGTDDGQGGLDWVQYSSGTSREDGTYDLRVPASSLLTFRFARGGFTPQFLGGGSDLPTTATPENSRTSPASGGFTIEQVVLQPFPSALGNVAGQRLDYCRTTGLPANDDGSSQEVPLPFDLTYFGTPYRSLWVNNNGNVTFTGPQSQYTPSDLTGPTGVPIIAPFFADVDTRGAGSNLVTYGTSPDGRTLCVNWADVGYFSSHDDRLNTFQLLLTRQDGGAGRTPGDFDMTFNYDGVQWETGDASNGVGGLGGTSAAAGFSAGTGEPGTFVQLDGSFVNGALLDGGPNALVSGSQGSTQQGRYVFQVRNEGLTSGLGTLAGSVADARDSSPVGGAYVQACRSNGTGCSYTDTVADGSYTFAGLLGGSYELRVWPPDDSLFGGGATATVVAGETTTVPAIALNAPTPQPDNVTLNGQAGSGGVPSVYYGDPVQLRVTGCAGLTNPTYTVRLASGQVVRDALPMLESPAGVYTATIAPLAPSTGDAEILTTIPATCGGTPTAFNVYIDPSGIVTDQYGRPIEGATVTLSRSDTQDGVYTVVPDGSDIMSPSNRRNPSITDAAGFFRWDVQSGWYKVTAEAPGCSTTTSPGLEVPPERIDLVLKSTCDRTAPTPATAPRVTGTAQVGSTITAVDATWTAPLTSTGVVLQRNGVALPDASYQLTQQDVGATFTAVATGRRPDYVTEAGAGDTVSFSPVTATSAPVTGTAAPVGPGPVDPGPVNPGPVDPGPVTPAPTAPTAATPAAPSGSGKVGTSLLSPADPTWSQTGVTTTRQWLRDGQAVAGETGTTYELTAADLGSQVAVRFVGTRSGSPSGTVTSAAATVVRGDAPTSTVAPRVSGAPRPGSTLTVTPGGWLGSDLAFTYQWLRDGVAITGATAESYLVTTADLGRSLTSRVTATRAGYADGVATAAPVVTPQAASTSTARLDRARVRKGKVVRLLAIVRSVGGPVPGGVVRVTEGTRVLRSATLRSGGSTLALPKLRQGRHTLVLRYLGDAVTSASRARPVTLTVTRRR